VSFLVKSVEAGTTSTSSSGSGEARAGGGLSNHDVVILEISRILLGGRRRLLKPVSDIAAMLKHASDCAWEEREEMLEKSEREEEGSDPDDRKDADGPAYSSLAAQLEIVEEAASNSNKSPADFEFSIMDAEAVVGEATDYYVLTLFSDIFAFVFAMVFYQACMSTR